VRDIRVEPAAFDYVCPDCGGDIKTDDPVVFYRDDKVMRLGVWLMCQACYWNEWKEVDRKKNRGDSDNNCPQ
jgi:predicted RNA-binding Zn-ribbon protein involved in translation (DUF1610 family)